MEPEDVDLTDAYGLFELNGGYLAGVIAAALAVGLTLMLRQWRQRSVDAVGPLERRLAVGFRVVAILIGVRVAVSFWQLWPAEYWRRWADTADALAFHHRSPLGYLCLHLEPVWHGLFLCGLWLLAPLLARSVVRADAIWTAAVARWLGWTSLVLAAYLFTLLGWYWLLSEAFPRALFAEVLAWPASGVRVHPVLEGIVLAGYGIAFLWLAPPILRTAIPPETGD